MQYSEHQYKDIGPIVNETINLYPIAVDSRRWVIFDRVFTPDVKVDFGGDAVMSGLEMLKSAFEMIHAPFQSTQHTTTNHQVVINGDAATAISYVHGRFIRQVSEGGNLFESTGWYDDALVRTPMGWRIHTRISRMTWWSGNPLVLQTAPGAGVPESVSALSAEADGGRVTHLQALAGN